MAHFLFFILGLFLLVLGAELLVRGASKLALLLKISPLIIGLTVVAFGTSSPELAVSLKAALADHPDIVIGTNVGSTIFNILFILGISSLITPLVVHQKLVWVDVPVMISAHLLLFLFCFQGILSKGSGAMLFILLIAYTLLAIYSGKKESKEIEEEYKEAFGEVDTKNKAFPWISNLLLIIFGLLACVQGASFLVDSTVAFARTFGVSELVIAVTIISAGTSLPEVATSVVAALRGERDIAIGNVVGSNIFNILGIIGLSALFTSNGIKVSNQALFFDLPIAIGCTVLCLPVFFSKHTISRFEGVLFLLLYVLYIFSLIY